VIFLHYQLVAKGKNKDKQAKTWLSWSQEQKIKKREMLVPFGPTLSKEDQ